MNKLILSFMCKCQILEMKRVIFLICTWSRVVKPISTSRKVKGLKLADFKTVYKSAPILTGSMLISGWSEFKAQVGLKSAAWQGLHSSAVWNQQLLYLETARDLHKEERIWSLHGIICPQNKRRKYQVQIIENSL